MHSRKPAAVVTLRCVSGQRSAHPQVVKAPSLFSSRTFHRPRRRPAPSAVPPPPPGPGIPRSALCLRVCLFGAFRVHGTTQCVALWITSLRMFLRSPMSQGSRARSFSGSALLHHVDGGRTALCSSIRPLMDTWVVSRFWLL